MRKFTLILALAALHAAPAMAQNAKFVWSEVPTPDGTATVKMPCAAKDIETEVLESGGFNMTCKVGQHVFNVVAGLPSTAEDAGGRVNTYDDLAKMAAGFPDEGLVTTGMIGNRRTLAIGCRAKDGSTCIRMIDRGKLPPLALAYSGDPDAFDDLPSGERARVNGVIIEFSNSARLKD